MTSNVNWDNVNHRTDGSRVECTTWSQVRPGDEFYFGAYVYKAEAIVPFKMDEESLVITATRNGRVMGDRIEYMFNLVYRLV